MAGLLLLPTVWVAVSRFRTVPLALAFGAVVLFLAAGMVYGGDDVKLSLSMHYNRWAWAVVFLPLALVILPAERENALADGAVIGADGTLWLAEWGASGVTGYAPDGTEVARFTAPATQISCPAFGGPDMTTLFATSASESLDDPDAAQGQTFTWQTPFKGQPEHQVIL